MPSRPLRAMPTTSMSPSNCNNLRMFSRVSAKSSTINTRIFCPALFAIIRLVYPSKRLRSNTIVQLSRQRNVELLEHVLQGDTLGVHTRRIAGRAQGQCHHHGAGILFDDAIDIV